MAHTGIERLAWIRIFVFGFLLAALMAAGLLSKPAHAADFTVNSTNDPGSGGCDATECTLREAITAANSSSGADTIKFNIPGTGVKTISPTSPLPDITDSVTIDGYTQPGASPNTQTQGDTNAVLLVELNGQNAGSALGLLIKAPASGTSAGSVVRGLAINRFSASGVSIEGGTQVTDVKIEGNFIGTDPSGTQDLGNGQGVFYNATYSTIGGTSPEARNLISGNDQAGIFLGQIAARARIEGNLIGTSKDGASALGNSTDGVAIGAGGLSQGRPNNVVGGESAGAANTIAFNGGDGVNEAGCSIVPGTGDKVCGTGNSVLSNSIFSNGGLGIDLVGGTEDANGRTANDPGDVDDQNDGPNLLQNFPEITFASSTIIAGTLNSTPNAAFTLQFFSDPPGEDEGKTFLGEKSVSTDASGNASFFFAAPTAVSVGNLVTATATDVGGNTSEFSEGKAVQQLSPPHKKKHKKHKRH